MKKETIAKFYSNYKLYIFPAVVALSNLFLIVFVIYPQTMKLINSQAAIGDLTAKSELLETKVAALESYDEADLSRKVGFVLATLPTDKDYGNVLGLLQQLTSEFGFSINAISFSNTANKLGNSDSFGVKLGIKGAKVMFQPLLDSLENSRRLFRLNSIDVSSDSISQILEASLAIEVLYVSQSQNYGSMDSALPELSQEDEELIARLARLGGTVSSSSAMESPRGKANPFE